LIFVMAKQESERLSPPRSRNNSGAVIDVDLPAMGDVTNQSELKCSGPPKDADRGAVSTEVLKVVSASSDLKLTYGDLPGLTTEMRTSLSKLDVDGNGEVSLGEMMFMTKTTTRLKRALCYLTVALIFIVGAVSAISYCTALLAKDSTLDDKTHALTVKGSSGLIVHTAHAEITLPLALVSLLDIESFGRIEQVIIEKMAVKTQGSARMDLPRQHIMQVDAAMLFNETYATLFGSDGSNVTVNHGEITLHGVPGFPGFEFHVCARAKCSSISISGANIDVLQVQANNLNFGQAGLRCNHDQEVL